MNAQPAGATGTAPIAAASLGAAPGEAGKAADTNLLGVPSDTDTATFMVALLAVAAAPDFAGALPSSTILAEPKAVGTGVAAPEAASLRSTATSRRNAAVQVSTSNSQLAGSGAPPPDLSRALFAQGTIGPELGGAGRPGVVGGAGNKPAAAATSTAGKAAGVSGKGRTRSGHDILQAANTKVATPTDPGAALLATVLQWLQQQRDVTHDAALAADVPGGGHEADSPGMAAQVAAATQSGARTHGARTEVELPVGAQGTAPARDASPGVLLPGIALPGVVLPDPLAGQRGPVGRAAPDERLQPLSAAAREGAVTAAASPAGSNAAAAGADMAAVLRASSAATVVPAERSVAVPVHDRHWPAALATQLLILSSDKMQAATLRLTPEHLGPVEVRIDMHDAQVNVNFTAAHAETRAALEQAMPQLRAVLEGAGLTLGQATVQQQARRESQNSGATTRPAGAANEPPDVAAAVTRAVGMIDEFV